MIGIGTAGDPASQCQHNKDRMRRAGAWIKRSEQKGTKDIERFMFLWIAFNAAYGNEAALRDFVEGKGGKKSESHRFKAFLGSVVEQDRSDVLGKIMWDEFSGSIRELLNNHYVFQPFWKAIWGSARDVNWRVKFQNSVRRANRAVEKRDILTVLLIVFDRLYALRNQIFHGGATYPSGFGHEQIRDGSRIMASLIPAVIGIMQQDINRNPDSQTWGKVAYPHINAAPK